MTMRILMVGGGSGGHVTPLKAVAREVQKSEPNCVVTVITDRKFGNQTKQIFSDMPGVKVKTIFAGKFRRYNTKSLAWHFIHLPTVLKNVFDLGKTMIGIFQAVIKLATYKPDVVFCKGGFVSVPIGFATHLFGTRMIIHDSDTHAGLSSRIISRWASVVATGMPSKYYSYPAEKMAYTGIPVGDEFQPVSRNKQSDYKKMLQFDSSPLLLLTGGGNGAERLNDSLLAVGEGLIKQGWQIAQITGRGKARRATELVKSLPKDIAERWHIEEFVKLSDYILASDVVVTRTGATTMQELANSEKTVITVPSKYLTGGHQLMNAQMFEDLKSVIVIDEDFLASKPEALVEAINRAEVDYKKGGGLAKNLKKHFAKPNSAKQIAELLTKT